MWCFLYCSIKREQSSFAGDGDRQRDTDRFTRQHPDRHRFRLTLQKENHQRYREREVEDSNLCLSSVKLHQRELLLHFFSLMRHPRIIGDSEFIINRCKLIHWQGRWPLQSKWPQTSAEYRSLRCLDPISLYRAFLKPLCTKNIHSHVDADAYPTPSMKAKLSKPDLFHLLLLPIITTQEQRSLSGKGRRRYQRRGVEPANVRANPRSLRCSCRPDSHEQLPSARGQAGGKEEAKHPEMASQLLWHKALWMWNLWLASEMAV